MTRLNQAHDAPAGPMRAPAILRVIDADPASWPRALGRATTLGFDALLLPGDPPPTLIDAAQALRVALLVDIDVAAAGCADDPDALAARCANRMPGTVGARLLGLDRLQAATLVPFLSALRGQRPHATVFGWTPGVAWSTLAAIPPGALDLVAASLPWWDGRADWLWQELDLLRRIAPVIADAGADPAREAFAAVLSEGWMTLDSAAAEPLVAMRRGVLRGLPWSRLASPAGTGAYALLRTDAAHPRSAGRAVLAFAAIGAARLDASLPLVAAGGAFGPFVAAGGAFGPFVNPEGGTLLPGDLLPLAPGALHLFAAERRPDPVVPPITRAEAAAAVAAPRIVIDAVSPCANGGGPPRAVTGSVMEIGCEITADGVTRVGAMLRWRGPDDDGWTDAAMTPAGCDHWAGRFPVLVPGIHYFMIEAWPDDYAACIDGPDPLPDQAARLIRAAAAISRKRTLATLNQALAVLADGDAAARRDILHAPSTRAAMARADRRRHGVATDPVHVVADRAEAGFAAWCSVAAADPLPVLPGIQAMGFDVLHLPYTTLNAALGAPPAPDAMQAMLDLRDAAARHGMELALDFAAGCVPDPAWSASGHRTAQPPGAADATPDLWCALAAAALFWARHGVRIFHVPDPLAMPAAFWAWLIPAIRSRHPDTLFAMALPDNAGPRTLRRLARAGFGQASTAPEALAVLECAADWAHGAPRPNMTVGVAGTRPAALAHAALAATLSGLWTLRHDAHCAAIAAEIAVLNGIRRRNPALHGNQGPTILDSGSDSVVLFQRATHDRATIVLVAVSLDTSQPQTVRIGHRWPTPMLATDLLHGGGAYWSGAERLATLTAEHPYALWRLCPIKPPP